MKKYLALLLALVMSLSLFACGKKEGDDNKDKDKTEYKVAMITDYGDITDHDRERRGRGLQCHRDARLCFRRRHC